MDVKSFDFQTDMCYNKGIKRKDRLMKATKEAMRIFTVIIDQQSNFCAEYETVSFTKENDAVKYALDFLRDMNIVDDENEADIKWELEETGYYDDDNGLVIAVECAELRDSFTGI